MSLRIIWIHAPSEYWLCLSRKQNPLHSRSGCFGDLLGIRKAAVTQGIRRPQVPVFKRLTPAEPPLGPSLRPEPGTEPGLPLASSEVFSRAAWPPNVWEPMEPSRKSNSGTGWAWYPHALPVGPLPPRACNGDPGGHAPS